MLIVCLESIATSDRCRGELLEIDSQAAMGQGIDHQPDCLLHDSDQQRSCSKCVTIITVQTVFLFQSQLHLSQLRLSLHARLACLLMSCAGLSFRLNASLIKLIRHLSSNSAVQGCPSG